MALEALKGVHPLSELASRHQLHPTEIAQWKRQLAQNAAHMFERAHGRGVPDADVLTAPLYQEVGRLKVEGDFLRKSAERTREGTPNRDRPTTSL